jgi:hypothetical protein
MCYANKIPGPDPKVTFWANILRLTLGITQSKFPSGKLWG